MTVETSDASMEGSLTTTALFVATYLNATSTQWSNGKPFSLIMTYRWIH